MFHILLESVVKIEQLDRILVIFIKVAKVCYNQTSFFLMVETVVKVNYSRTKIII